MGDTSNYTCKHAQMMGYIHYCVGLASQKYQDMHSSVRSDVEVWTIAKIIPRFESLEMNFTAGSIGVVHEEREARYSTVGLVGMMLGYETRS